jgi:putative pyrimidine permease RutG
MGMFDWTEKPADVLHQGGVIAPDERLPWPQTAVMGVQHVIAMFGATVLAPILMGFDPNVAILMSGIGTLIFFFITGGKVPSYLGSSFAFIGVVIAATAYAGKGPNGNIGVALGGIIACGLVYTIIGAIVQAVGTNWIEKVMPPVVTGAVVAVIGLNLASIPIKNMAASNFDSWMQAVTFVCVGLVAVFTRGMMQRLLILVGLIIASIIYAVLANGMGLGKPLDLSGIANAAWVGAPAFAAPVFDSAAMLLIVPVAIILVAENLGHIKAVTAMTGRNLDPYIGRAFIGDGVATMVSGAAGGTGVTTYAENIGVMAATKIYSTAVFVFAAVLAIVLGFSPKFGAVIQAIPLPVMGGVSIVVFGLIAAAGAKIWVDNRVDFSQNRNLIVAAITLILGTGDFTLKFGSFALGGIGTATFGAILLYALLNVGRSRSRKQRRRRPPRIACMPIWKKPISVEILASIHKDTAVERLGIEFLEVGDDFIRARVPVDVRTKQPYGLLHGGVSVVLAETLGSCGAAYSAPEGDRAVGLDINANHLRGATSGWVTGITRPVHIGRSTQVWQIDMTNDAGELTCVSRITMAVLQAR